MVKNDTFRKELFVENTGLVKKGKKLKLSVLIRPRVSDQKSHRARKAGRKKSLKSLCVEEDACHA